MAWSGGKCSRVRSIASTGPLLPAVVWRTKDAHSPSFPIIPDREGVLENYPDSLRRRCLRQQSPGLKRRVKRAARSARRHIAILAGR